MTSYLNFVLILRRTSYKIFSAENVTIFDEKVVNEDLEVSYFIALGNDKKLPPDVTAEVIVVYQDEIEEDLGGKTFVRNPNLIILYRKYKGPVNKLS